MFDSPTLERDIQLTLIEADKRLKEYEELSDIRTLEYKLETRNDFLIRANNGFYQKDASRAIVKMLLEKRDEAIPVFENAVETNNVAKALIDFCGDYEAFREQLIKIINVCRASMSENYKFELKSVSSISDLFPESSIEK